MKFRLDGFVLIAVLLFNTVSSQQKITPYVDERVELMSSIFRMIGAEEYSD